MEMSRSFGTNDITIGKFLPLLKDVRLTAKLSNVLAILGDVNNHCLFAFSGVTRESCLPFVGLHWR